MTNQPLISVIIPVYNREKYIKNCLDILLNQSYKNLEIIVVDDGSSDNSVKIVKQYPAVKLIQHTENKGQSVARNTGIDNATGKYIHFMDDDDEINPTFYENLLKASEETNADMSCCSMINQKRMNKSQIFDKQKVYETIKGKYEATYVGKYGYSVRYLFKLDFLKNHNLRFEQGRLIEDLPFSFQAVFYANKIVSVPKSTYTYVFNPTSSMNIDDKEIDKRREVDYEYATQFILNFAKKNGNFTIPGVNSGKLKCFLKKVETGIKFAIKYKNIEYLKF